MCNSPRLSAPDFQKKFCKQTYASEIGVGAIFFQWGDIAMEKNIIAYESKKLGTVQQRYSADEGECLTATWTINKFRWYLEADCFELLTDNIALCSYNKNVILTK